MTSITLRGVTSFGQTATVDLSSQRAGLIAMVGENGQGKTTLMESVPGALYKTMPSRKGSLYEHCHGRDAFISLTFRDPGDSLIEVRLTIDAEKRTTEGYVLVDGESQTQGRAVEFEAVIARLFGSYELFLTSVFASQDKAGSFLTMTKGDRKALFIELLGLDRLQAMSERALEHRGAARRGLDIAKGREAMIVEELRQYESLPKSIVEAELLAEQKAAELVVIEKRLVEGREERTRSEAKIAERARAEAELKGLREELAAIVQKKQANAQENEQIGAQAKSLGARVVAMVAKADRPLHHAKAKVTALRVAIDSLQEHMSTWMTVTANAMGLKGRREAVLREIETLQDMAKAAKDATAGAPCLKADVWVPVLAAAEQPGLADSQRLAATCPLLAALAGDGNDEMEQAAKERLAEIERELADLARKDAEDVRPKIDAARAELKEEEAKEREDIETEKAIQECNAATGELASLEGRLKTARERRSEIEGERARTAHKIAVLEGATATLILTDFAYLDRLEVEYVSAQRSHAGVQQELGGLKAKQERAFKLADQTRECGKDVAATEVDASEWDFLTRALGRDGIQALEVDAAGPEVAGITNELLTSCYGARFSLAFETLREKKSAKGEYTETFDVKVYDQGHERQVEALSGGEKVIIGEALGLAFAIFNARKSNVSWRTLFRDETAGALSQGNAQAYIEMLRKALQIGNFHHVLFVSHSPEVWERADARIVVAGGRAELVGVQGSYEVIE